MMLSDDEDEKARSGFNAPSPIPWPESPLFEGVISQTVGLLTFTKTVARMGGPTEPLKATLRDSDDTG